MPAPAHAMRGLGRLCFSACAAQECGPDAALMPTTYGAWGKRSSQSVCPECYGSDSIFALNAFSWIRQPFCRGLRFQHKYIIKTIHRLCNKHIITFS